MARRKNPDNAPDYLRIYFETGAEPNVHEQPDEWLGLISMLSEQLQAAWENARADILPTWIRQHPCTRPFAWWCYDAPEGRLKNESQAVYLKRHALLTNGEKRHLAKNKDTLLAWKRPR